MIPKILTALCSHAPAHDTRNNLQFSYQRWQFPHTTTCVLPSGKPVNVCLIRSHYSFLSICFSAPAANGLSTISHEYLKGSYALDLEAVKQGACSLPHLNKTLVASCKRLNG